MDPERPDVLSGGPLIPTASRGRDHRGIDETRETWGEMLRRAWQPPWGPQGWHGRGGPCVGTWGRGPNGGSESSAVRLDSADEEAQGHGLGASRSERPFAGRSGPEGGHWHSGHGHWRVPRQRGRLRRSRDARLIGGVAEGLSKKIGIDVTIIRVGLVLFGLASGTGVAAYVLAWLFVPVEGEDENIAQRALEDRRGLTLAIGLFPLLVAAFILGTVLGAGWIDSITWAAGISAAGLILIWRNAPEEDRAVLERLAQPVIQLVVPEGRSWARVSVRAVVGAALLAGGLVCLLIGHPSGLLVRSLVGVLLVMAAFVVAFGPWWLGLARDLVVERQARALAEERANMVTRRT